MPIVLSVFISSFHNQHCFVILEIYDMYILHSNEKRLLRSYMCTVHYGRRMDYGIGQAIIFLPCGFYLSFFFFSSPSLSRRRLDVYHTSKHGVALVRI